jgi:signal transduction histidine kinase
VRLQSLIERILSIAAPASIEARATGTIEMRGFLADMVASFIPLAQRRRVTISVEVEHRLTAVGDAMRLRRALHEIIDNAVRYSTPGTLTIRAIAHDGLAIVSVSDPGPGIPDDEQAELFSRFFRGRQTRALASTPGAGIGLSIAQREIELLGGRVWLERTGPMGTTMCLAVPTAAMPVMTEQVVLHERVLGGPDQPSS